MSMELSPTKGSFLMKLEIGYVKLPSLTMNDVINTAAPVHRLVSPSPVMCQVFSNIMIEYSSSVLWRVAVGSNGAEFIGLRTKLTLGFPYLPHFIAFLS